MNPIVRLAASALPDEKKYILFAGAGVSKDAGVPTAWDLMLETAKLLYTAENNEIDPSIDIQEWFLISKYADMTYSEIMEALFPNYPDQQDFLKKHLGFIEIGEAHRGIAELLSRGIIRAVVTTNFDHCIEKALEERCLDFQVISNDEDLKNSEPLINCKAVRIYKPHGDLGRGALKNTPKDLEKISTSMEKELVRVLSEHGVIVLGYAGEDKGIQNVFRKRSYNYYPLFWVNPSRPKDKIEEILNKYNYSYIHCEGASQFINNFLNLQERIKVWERAVGEGPIIGDLRNALSSSIEPASPLYVDYLGNLYKDLERIEPDFSKFEELDEAIVYQISEGIHISFRFLEASLLASKFRNEKVIETIYEFFGKGLRLYSLPEGFSGPCPYLRIRFDGYKFLLYEMFVSFIASLINYGNWEITSEILSNNLFLEDIDVGRYVSFCRINKYVESIDDHRKARLKLNRISLIADFLKERFTESYLAQLISFKDFLEADYFLFVRTVCHSDDQENVPGRIWYPRCCVYLRKPPSWMEKAESKKFLYKLSNAMGYRDYKEFFENIKVKYPKYIREFNSRNELNLLGYDYDKFGIAD